MWKFKGFRPKLVIGFQLDSQSYCNDVEREPILKFFR